MSTKPDLETLVQQALDMARRDLRYSYTSCYLKAALDSAKEEKKANKPS